MRIGLWERLRRFIFGAPKEYNLEALHRELKHPDASVREQAARTLGKLGDPAAILILFEVIQDRDEGVRRAAKASLEQLGWVPHSDNKMIEMPISEDDSGRLVPLLRDPDPAKRRDAARTLGEIGDPAFLDPLLQCLDDPDLSVQDSARNALKRLGWPSETPIPQDPLERAKYLVARKQWAELEAMGADAVPPLIEALKHPDKYVRWRAARTLGRMGSVRAIGPLIEAFRDPDPGVRKGVAYALGKLTGDPLVTPLEQVLNAREDAVRLEAARIIGLRQDVRILEPLIRILSPDLQQPDAPIRTLTMDIIAKLSLGMPSPAISQANESTAVPLGIGDATSVEAVIDLLEDPRQEKRLQKAIYQGLMDTSHSAESLSLVSNMPSTSTVSTSEENWSPDMVRSLLMALRDSNEENRKTATERLEQCQDIESIHLIVNALSTADDLQRASIQRVLAHIGSPAVGPLIDAFKDRNTELRGHAAETLVMMGKPSVESLIQTLKDPSDLVRWRAARTLGEIGDAEAIPSLIEALGEEDIFLRRDAAEALIEIGEKTVDPLVQALKEGQPPTRKEAAEVLGWLGDRRAIGPLLAALTDSSSDLRCAVIWALGELGDTSLENTLRMYLEDPDHQVRGAVQIALETIHRKPLRDQSSVADESVNPHP